MTLDDLRKREHFSYSSINQFFNICSLQWAFQRVYDVKPAFTPATLSFGSAFHRVMEHISTVRKEKDMPDKKDACDLFQDLWDRQVTEDTNIKFDEDITKESCTEQGRDMVACYVDSIDPAEEILEVNEVFAVPVEGNERPLIGEIDCVAKKNDKRYIVDWKTSARRWPKDKADKDLQPTILLFAYGQTYSVLPDFRFDVIVKNKTPVFEQHVTIRTHDHFQRLTRLINLMQSMIKAEHFYPNETSFYCSGCPFSENCKAWHCDRTKLISIRRAA
jgi:Holliday junction resolvase-like predicted endonuclease